MFGSKFFKISVRLIFGFATGFLLLVLFASLGWLNVLDYVEGNAKNITLCIVQFIAAIFIGIAVGRAISYNEKVSLVFLSIFNAMLLTSIVYDFFLSFTASLAILILTILFFLTSCTILPFKHPE